MLKCWLACLLKEAKRNKRKCKGFEGYLLDPELLRRQLAVGPNGKYGARRLRNLDLVISEALTSGHFSAEGSIDIDKRRNLTNGSYLSPFSESSNGWKRTRIR